MHRYVILTNRKGAIVALVHSVAFLGIALYGAITVVRPLGRASPTSAWILAGVYVAVSLALAALTAMAGNWRERLYFGFCTTSAGFGLLRQILGDPPLHYAVYVRIVMLACAVVTGVAIVRGHRGRDVSGQSRKFRFQNSFRSCYLVSVGCHSLNGHCLSFPPPPPAPPPRAPPPPPRPGAARPA